MTVKCVIFLCLLYLVFLLLTWINFRTLFQHSQPLITKFIYAICTLDLGVFFFQANIDKLLAISRVCHVNYHQYKSLFQTCGYFVDVQRKHRWRHHL